MAVLFLAPLVFAYQVALRNGAVVHFQKYRVVNNELLYLAESGEERSILLTDINFARTRELNEKENPPLDLDSLIGKMNAARKSAAPKPAQPPLGDVVHQLGLKPESAAEGRVFTDDDFPSSPVPPTPASAARSATPSVNSTVAASPAANVPNSNTNWEASKAKIELFLSRTENLTEEGYAARSLGPELANVQFPKRSGWQAEIYAAHRRYVANAKLCISDRISDEGWRQDAACANLEADKANVRALRENGKAQARDWKARQEKFASC
jgi:hypothetical protein